MKLFPKIMGIGIVGLLIAAVIVGISMYSGSMVRYYQTEEAKYALFKAQLVEARSAHLTWLRTITTAIITKKPELTIGTDGHKCNFGQWYYAEGTEVAKTLPKDFQDAFYGLAQDHLNVHNAGKELTDIWNPADLDPAIDLTVHKISPTADTLLGKLSALEKQCEEKIAEIDRHGKWYLENQTLPTMVALLIGLVILIPYAGLTALGITKPLHVGGSILDGIANQGILTTDMPEDLTRRRDEIGGLSRNIRLVLEDYRTVAQMAKELAEGNWQHSISEKSPDDTLNQNFAVMFDNMNRTLSEINTSASQVATGSGEVSNAAQNLSSGAQEAAASLEQITASMSEIAGQTKKNAENASQARDGAVRTSKAVAEGQEAMKSMTSAMEKITQNSNEIQRVIKVIDDIAFQTNLLALNAAVEAARAGQHGKGFAVVAEEVRNLAARSAKAAKETSELIAKSGQEIDKGGEVASHTASVLDTIVDQIKQTTDLVASIANSSNEQAQGVNQVTLGLQQIDSVTQQNTAASEESASAANEMNTMAANLQKLIAQFKLRV